MWNRESRSWVKKLATTVKMPNGKLHSVLRRNVSTNFSIDLYIKYLVAALITWRFNGEYSILLSKNIV